MAPKTKKKYIKMPNCKMAEHLECYYQSILKI